MLHPSVMLTKHPTQNSIAVIASALKTHFDQNGMAAALIRYITVKHAPPQSSIVQCVLPRQSISIIPYNSAPSA